MAVTDVGTEFSKAAESAPCRDDSDRAARPASGCQDFGELYDLHYGQILNYLYRQTLDVHLAEDLTSNTFFNALRGMQTYRESGNSRAWLYRIATNELKMHWRSENRLRLFRRSPLEPICRSEDDHPAIEDNEEIVAGFAQLKTAMDGLPERYRTAIMLRYFEKMSYSEIAEVLGKRTTTVRSLVHRGLGRLRHLMRATDLAFPPGPNSERKGTRDETE